MRLALVLLCLAAFASCSTTATVLVRDGTRYEVQILGGDKDTLLLQSEYGVEKVVRRSEVGDIDHPGNVMALVGGLIGGSGALNLVSVGLMCSTSGASSGSQCPLLFGMMGGTAALGVGMFVWGLWTWLGSKNAVSDSLLNPAVPMPVTPLPPPTNVAPPTPTAPRLPVL